MARSGSNGGNTIPRCSASKRWCFTLNNYTEEHIKTLVARLAPNKYLFSKEVGESGTHHLQGFVEFDTKCRPIEKIRIKEIHWEKMKGSIESNIIYCTKEGGQCYYHRVKPKKPLKVIKDLYPWQSEIVEIVKKEPDDRIIYWIYEKKGNVGKSALVKYLAFHHNALVVSGKGSDMKYLCVKFKETYGDYPELIILDIPRSCENYISWSGIEEVKNGCFASTKYECEMVLMNSPHILCFANFKPNMNLISRDRWSIKRIGG